MTAATSTSALPKIGARAAGMQYHGVATLPDGTVYALCRLDAKPPNSLNHAAALAWAQAQDADLASRVDAALLTTHLKDGLPYWFWLNETYGASCAWYCSFYDGTQHDSRKSAEGAAVAVRRFPIQSFDPLVFA